MEHIWNKHTQFCDICGMTHIEFSSYSTPCIKISEPMPPEIAYLRLRPWFRNLFRLDEV